MYTEEPQGRCLGAVGPVPEVRDVEVALEDLVLGPDLFEPERKAHLAELAGGGAGRGRGPLGVGRRGRHQDLLDVLLGDRRPALDALPLEVADQRPREAVDVDALVLVEAGVLDCDDRLLQQRRDRRQGHADAVLGVDGRQQNVVGGVDLGLLRQQRLAQDAGEVLEVLAGRLRGRPDAAHEREQEPGDEHAGERAHDQEEAKTHQNAHRSGGLRSCHGDHITCRSGQIRAPNGRSERDGCGGI